MNSCAFVTGILWIICVIVASGHEKVSSSFNCHQTNRSCLNGGTCISAQSSPNLTYTCLCKFEYSGPRCEFKNRPRICQENPCANDGTCLADEAKGYICACPDGFLGRQCQFMDIKIAGCANGTCPFDSRCVDGKCVCRNGFIGMPGKCKRFENADPCSQEPCRNGGRCIAKLDNPNKRFLCKCDHGFSGEFCELRRIRSTDACSHVICEPGHRCTSMSGGIHKCVSVIPILHSPPILADSATQVGIFQTDEVTEKSSISLPTAPPFPPHQNNNIHDSSSTQQCSSQTGTASGHSCLNNGRCLRNEVGGFSCLCTSSWTGASCETPIDINCDTNPCVNNGTCVENSTGFNCECPAEFGGKICEKQIHTCDSDCQNGGSCSQNGTCICPIGFTGQSCEINIDHCIGIKCPHGKICIDSADAYECRCPAAYFGAECEFEAVSNEECGVCKNGATCLKRRHDSEANFTCVCRAGYTGQDCEREVNECELYSNPCLNGGTCLDGLVGYECQCLAGFTGLRCDARINDGCASNPCPSDSVCTASSENIEGYTCTQIHRNTSICYSNPCLNGGTCMENTTSQFTCICPHEYSGLTCQSPIQEIDISGNDHCEDGSSNPCQNAGTCHGTGQCLCPVGFTGSHCEDDVNECESNPCQDENRICVNTFGGYYCECSRGWSGKQCDFELIGCESDPCTGSNSVCQPRFDHGNHSHICKCADGFHGPDCAEDSTVSFTGNSLMYHLSNTPSAGNYWIKFQFRTTLENTILVEGVDISPSIVYALSLRSGLLYLDWGQNPIHGHTKMDTGHWYGVELIQNSTHIQLEIMDENTLESLIAPKSIGPTLPIFTTKFGGLTTSTKSYFVGCMRDIFVNDDRLITTDSRTSLNVIEGCQRRDQCANSNLCGGLDRGKCLDMWSAHSCQCKRPYFSSDCSGILNEATFGHEGNSSYLEMITNQTSRKEIELILDISMLIRTRASDGILAYLGSNLNPDHPNRGYLSFLTLEISGGRLKSIAQLGTAQPQIFADEIRKSRDQKSLDDGQIHLIRLIRRENEIKGYVDDVSVINGHLNSPFPYPLLIDHFYLGGLPSGGVALVTRQKRRAFEFRPKRQGVPQIGRQSFKGTIQDVRINRAFLPILKKHIRELSAEKIFGEPILHNNVLEGTVSDDTCKSRPCQNSAACRVTFNDYNCTCPDGWWGKNCTFEDLCAQKKPCENSRCHNLQKSYSENTYICTQPVTLNETSSGVFYASKSVDFEQSISSADSDQSISIRFEIRTRSADGMIMMIIANPDRSGESADKILTRRSTGGHPQKPMVTQPESYLILEITNGSLDIKYSIQNTVTNLSMTNKTALTDGQWHTVAIEFLSDGLEITVDDEKSIIANDVIALQRLLKSAEAIFIGNPPDGFSQNEKSFKGCLNDVRFGQDGWLLFQPQQIPVDELLSASKSGQIFTINSTVSIQDGCFGDAVCQGTCENGATCEDEWNQFKCQCPFGFEGILCEKNIDDCINHGCSNGAACLDGIGNYTCSCVNGYSGIFCETNIDDCTPMPCQNNGTCLDLVAGYECQCNGNYTGSNCEIWLLVDCASDPCQHGAKCTDLTLASGQKTFNCTCPEAYTGRVCEKEKNFCEGSPCMNGGNCTSHIDLLEYRCSCVPGFTGRNCEENVDECLQNPCLHGTCIDGWGNFSCECSAGWTGEHCELDLDECENSPCTSTGHTVCVNSPGSYRCECPKHYFGDNCQIPGECLKNPCLRGNCTQSTATSLHNCECPYGFTGSACESEINFCDSDPCANGGTCQPFTGGYQCACAVGFTGPSCETNIDECDPNPCINGGRCVDGIGEYICNCTGTGYSGPICSEDLDECQIQAMCLHSINCKNTIGSYNCTCQSDYLGQRCDLRNPCHSNATHNCQNGGRCMNARIQISGGDWNVQYDCACVDGFQGDFCQIKKPEASIGRLEYILGPIAGALGIILIFASILFGVVLKNKRATHGTYSPSRQEISGARMQMGAMIKPPPEERLI